MLDRGQAAKWVGLTLLVVWIGGLVPFYFATPVGDSVAVLAARWRAPLETPPPVVEEPTAEPTAVAEAPTEVAVAAVAPTEAALPTPTPLALNAAGGDAASIVGDAASDEQAALPGASAADEGRYAFLLMGYGGGGHDGGYLTDSMMVVVVDPKKKSLTMLSLPRDSWVPMLFDGKTPIYNKLNTAYAFAKDQSLYRNRLPQYTGAQGAGTFAADTVSRILGVPIRYYVTLDFAGFRQMIDAVGGVDVDVPRSFAALYPANDDPSIDSSWMTVRFRAGMQHMTGERAIQYARAREAIDDSGEGSDFARSRRQRLIMEAFKTRFFQPGGLLALPRLMSIVGQHVDTNYDVPGVTQIGELLLDWKSVEIYQTALTLENYLDEGTGPEGAYLLLPRLEDHTWSQVRAFARRLWDDPSAGVASSRVPITVVNASGVSGVAGRVTSLLARRGYFVRDPISAETHADSRLIDRSEGAGNALARVLEKDLGVSLGSPTVDSTAKTTGVFLEIGSADARLLEEPLPVDGGAPTSAVGITRFGGWVPAVEPVAPTPTPHVSVTTTAHAVGTGTATARGTGTPAASGTPSGSVTPAGSSAPSASGTPRAGTPLAIRPLGSGTPGAAAGTATRAAPPGAAPQTGTPAPAKPAAVRTAAAEADDDDAAPTPKPTVPSKPAPARTVAPADDDAPTATPRPVAPAKPLPPTATPTRPGAGFGTRPGH